MEGLLVVAAVLAVSTVVGLLHARRGRFRETATPAEDDLRPLVRELGAEPGDRATLLQFSSAFCSPCRATRRTLAEVSAMVDGVAHVEVDAEQHLDVVRRLNILTTPTTLVLDARGRVTTRAAGQPRKADVIAALGQAVPS